MYACIHTILYSRGIQAKLWRQLSETKHHSYFRSRCMNKSFCPCTINTQMAFFLSSFSISIRTNHCTEAGAVMQNIYVNCTTGQRPHALRRISRLSVIMFHDVHNELAFSSRLSISPHIYAGQSDISIILVCFFYSHVLLTPDSFAATFSRKEERGEGKQIIMSLSARPICLSVIY